MLLLDSGNFSDNPTPEGDVHTRTLLAGMERMGYAAVNVGERDIKMGTPHLAERTAHVDLPFVSANIVRQDSKRPVYAPHAVVEARSADGTRRVRVGVIGVARHNPVLVKAGPDGSNVILEHPAERVRAEVAALRGQSVELVVLLAALHKDDARRMLRDVPGVDVLIGSYGGALTPLAEKEGETFMLYSGNQGKNLGETRVFLGPGPKIQHQITLMHYLTAEYPAIPMMQQFVDDARIGGRLGRAVSTGDSRWVGSAACRECHETAFAQWSDTAHAISLLSLERQGKRAEPACGACHTTGAGAAGGFRDEQNTPELAHVGCESCHGAGKGHLVDPTAAYGAVSVSTCTGCHDPANSPHFDYYAYRARVTHASRATR